MATTLSDFLTPLKTGNVQIVIKNLEQEDICKIYADSVSSLDSKLTARTVNRWDIIRNNLIYLYLNNPEVDPEPVPVTGISLNVSSLSLDVGTSETLLATIEPSDATNQNVLWISTDETIATVDGGIVNAISEGNSTIIATSEDGDFSATCEVSVALPVIQVESVTLSESELSLVMGASEYPTLTAIVLPSDATYELIWASSNENVVTVENGVLNVLSEGEALITASAGDVVSEPCIVTVSAQIISVEGIELTESSIELTRSGETYTLIPIITPINATNQNVTWSSSDESVATVNNGVIEALDNGITTITVITEDGGFEANCNVEVSIYIQVENIELSESELNLNIGDSDVTITATVTPEDATLKDNLLWASSNENVVTVNNGVISIIGAGTASVTASADDVISQPCEVIVTES